MLKLTINNYLPNVLHFHGKNIKELTRTFDIIYNNQEVDSNYNKDELAIVSTWTDEKKCYLLQQCRRFNIPLINCVSADYDTTQDWYMPNKIRFFLNTLYNLKQDVVMFLDGYDVLLTHLDDVVEKFKNQKYHILFGSSCNNFPDINIDVVQNRVLLGTYRFFNAGCVIGYRKDLIKFYEESLQYIDKYNVWNSEQLILRYAFKNYSNDKEQTFVFFDYASRIFQSMGVMNSCYDNNAKTVDIKTSFCPYNIIVTGSDGFIGQALAKKLKTMGHFVYCLDRKSNTEADSINAIIDNFNIDIVFHLAAQTSVFNQNKKDIIRDNIDTFVKISDACKNHGVKLVYASSSTANMNNITSLYGMSKMFDELYAKLYFPEATGVRLHNIYSENPRTGTLMWHALNDDIVKLYNNGQNKRCFTYIDDAVNGLIYAAFSKLPLYNCVNQEEITTEQFVQKINNYKNIKYQLCPEKRNLDNSYQHVDNSIPTIPIKYQKVDEVMKKIFCN